MGEFRAVLSQRLAESQAGLERASAEGDLFLIETHRSEIEDLRRLAAENGVQLPRCA